MRIFLAVFCLAVCTTSSAEAQTLDWTQQLGTSEKDLSNGVSADGLGSVYISGGTRGTLDGTSAGGWDAFISKYNASGAMEWTRQLGTSSTDVSLGVSADGLGNVYMSGAMGDGAFVTKYSASGTLEWTQTLGSILADQSEGVSADGLGNVYISGITQGDMAGPHAGGTWDAFISKYDAGGRQQWTRQLGTSSRDLNSDISADRLGNVYITGSTEGDLDGINAGGRDAFLSKYDADGTLEWSRQLGTNRDDDGSGVSADGFGNVYITGVTEGSLGGVNAGNRDAFLAKYDEGGTLLWIRQLGTNRADESNSVSVDVFGNVYISGWTNGSLDGPNAGDIDVFVSRYDASGVLDWTRQFGTSEWDESEGVSADGSGNVYLSGFTGGDLMGMNKGDFDTFVAKYSTTNPDFNSDGVLDCIDIDALVAEIAAGTHAPDFDLTGDGLVDIADLDEWRIQAGAVNLPSGNPYLVGDATLDGIVDGLDFINWNANKFTSVAAWCSADLTADGVVDGEDFALWNDNKFMSSAGMNAVPEPAMGFFWMVALIGSAVAGRRCESEGPVVVQNSQETVPSLKGKRP